MSQDPTSNITIIVDNQTGRETTADRLSGVISFLEPKMIGDDRGLKLCDGQLAIGSPECGDELVVGEGDSYPVPIAFHCTVANTTDLVITDAIDVTEVLQSDDNSVTGLFNGISIGNYIIVGSDYRFSGIKAKVDTAGVVEPENIQGEYLKDSTPSWVLSSYMATDANYPYLQKGNILASESLISEHWRFGFNPIDIPTPWDKVSLTINGVLYPDKYWARFRINTEITSDPQLQQIKLHTSRWECNEDGNTEYFGRARYPKSVEVTKTSNALKSPISQDISIAPGISEARIGNEFQKLKDDGFILSGLVGVGRDTSIPSIVIIEWYPQSNLTGNVELTVDTVVATRDFIYDGNAPIVHSESIITSVANDQYKPKKSIFLIPIDTALSNDRIYLSVHRDANSASDTYDGNIVIVDYHVVGHFWRS